MKLLKLYKIKFNQKKLTKADSLINKILMNLTRIWTLKTQIPATQAKKLGDQGHQNEIQAE